MLISGEVEPAFGNAIPQEIWNITCCFKIPCHCHKTKGLLIRKCCRVLLCERKVESRNELTH